MAIKTVHITSQDIQAIATIVQAEAANILAAGYTLREAYGTIIDVIINRAAANTYSIYENSSIQNIINAKKVVNSEDVYQFSALQGSSNGLWTGLASPDSLTIQYVKDHLADRISGTGSSVGFATHYFNETRANPDWEENFTNTTGVGQNPYDANGNQLGPSDNIKSHTFGNPVRDSGALEPLPNDYIIEADLNGDLAIGVGETSPEFDNTDTSDKLSGNFNSNLDDRNIPIPGHKPDVPSVTAEEMNAIAPDAGSANGGDNDGDTKDAEYVEDIKAQFETSKNRGSPLALDIDGLDGVELTSLHSVNSVYWDIDNDGFAEASGFITGGDGLLAIDLNEDGIINNSTELFGNQTGYSNGFLALAAYDSNADGVITAGDAYYNDLIVWIDNSNDGYSQADELYTLGELLITSINLAYTDVNYTISGNEILQESTFTINGNTRTIVDAYFSYSNVNTVYNRDFILDYRTMFLPAQSGCGELAALHIAMSIDNTGAGNLLNLVSSFNGKTFAQIFDSTTNTLDAVRDIMYRWAGVDGVSPTARGPLIDGRSLGFLESLMGQPFIQRGIYTNPVGWEAAGDLNDAFTMALNNFYARLVAQSAGGELFEGDWYYDIATDSIKDVTGLNQTNLDALETEASGLANTAARQVFWENVVRMVEYTVGTSNLDSGDLVALQTAITDSDTTLDLEDDILPALPFQRDIGVAESGTSGDDTLNGSSADDMLDGVAGNDVVNGLGGNDKIYGGNGNDTLNGGAGHDTLNGNNNDDILYGDIGDDYMLGGSGADEYLYNLGDGTDTIIDAGGADKLTFGAGIDINDLAFTRTGSTDLIIDIDTGSATGRIYVEDHFKSGYELDSLYFNDLSSFTFTNVNWTMSGTAGNDTLYGAQGNTGDADTIYGLAGNDYIEGYLGEDTLYGGDGDDIIHGGGVLNTYYGETDANILIGDAGNDKIYGSYGNDEITGGTGNDTLTGRLGDDSYYFNLDDGNDTITEQDSGTAGIDTLYLGAGIAATDVSFVRQGTYDLKILINGGQNGSILVVNQFSTAGGTGALEYVELDDTTVIDLTTMSFGQIGTSAGETLHGNNSGSGSPDDTIYGEGGNDIIYGYLGADDLHGGDGNDTIHVGHTVNTYYGKTTTNRAYGDAGDDNLYGSYGVDHIYGGTGDDYMMGRYGNDHYYFNRGEGTDEIEEIGFVSGGAEVDTLHLGPTIDADDLTYVRDGNYNFKILISGGSGGTINVTDQFNSGAGNGGLEYIKLSDNSQITLGSLDFVLNGTSSGETLHGAQINSAGNDTIYALGGNDIVGGYLGADYIYGGDGNDTLYAYTNVNINTDTSSNWLYGEDGADTLHGSGGADTLDGGIGNDTLNGNNGDDTLIGGAGDDGMAGHAGNDTYRYSAGLDTVTDTSGTDTLFIEGSTTVNDITFSSVSTYNTKITVSASVDEITVVNLRHGTAANHVDFIEFADGFKTSLPDYATWTNGTTGADTLTGTSGDNTIIGFAGADTLDGAGGADDIHGGAGNDVLYGGAGADLLHGGVDDDTLYGQDGLDTLFGGAGADTFVFETATAFNNVDVIKDFSTAQNDVLDLSDLLGGFDPLNDAITDFVWITESAGNSNVFVDRDGLGGTYSLTAIATLSNTTGLTDEAALLANGHLLAA